MKQRNLLLSLAFIATISLTFTSCEKLGDDLPDYIGYWTTDEIIQEGDYEITMRNTLSLTESGFEFLVQMVGGTTMLELIGDTPQVFTRQIE